MTDSPPASRFATRPETGRIIVSLHDVAPPYVDAIRTQLELLAAIGVRRVVLKVVPNWHGAHPLERSSALLDLLHAQAATGSQVVLHGFEHRPRGPFRGDVLSRMRARLFAAQAAEFLTLSTGDAEVALRKGLAAFAQAGLAAPLAFCAPGWLCNAAAEAALKRVGFRYLIGMFGLRRLHDSRRIATPGIGYMGASPGQEAGVQILNGIVRHTVLPSAPVAKVYLHPQSDPGGPLVLRILRAIERMIQDEGRQPATYDEVYRDE